MALLHVHDLAAFATIDSAMAAEMVADASALAVLAAPCLGDEAALTVLQLDQVRAVLRSVVRRWNDTGSGALQSEGIGSYNQTFDTRQPRRGLFWPSEITQLQAICAGEKSAGGAFAIDTSPRSMVVHSDICALAFGALYCSCGAVLTLGLPLYEVNP